MTRFSSGPPLAGTKGLARLHDCDIALPTGPGLGNVLCCTRVVEELAFRLGRPLRILTGPLRLSRGFVRPTEEFAVWQSSPFVRHIENLEAADPSALGRINREKDDLCQFSHIIDNLCSAYGLRPRRLRPSLFLSLDEMTWALDHLAGVPRPIVALHPFGKTSSPEGSPWFRDRWLALIAQPEASVSFLQLGVRPIEDKVLPVPYPSTSLREAFALLWASDAFLGFDSALAHVATAFEKPALVLWDVVHKESVEVAKEPGFAAALLLRWAYPQNRNIVLLGERDEEALLLCREFLRETTRSFQREVPAARPEPTI